MAPIFVGGGEDLRGGKGEKILGGRGGKGLVCFLVGLLKSCLKVDKILVNLELLEYYPLNKGLPTSKTHPSVGNDVAPHSTE